MKAINQWSIYRTRFLVNAKQLTTSLTFTDALGRQHTGHKGDYLIESEGVLRIQPRQIFEDIYVPLSARLAIDESSQAGRATSRASAAAAAKTSAVSVQTVRSKQSSFALSPSSRKSPQPHRDRQTPGAGLGSL